MLATANSGDVPEVGMQALVGDPFDFGGSGGGFSFASREVDTPPPPPGGSVPEPGTLGILGLGLALSGIASRRRKKLPLSEPIPDKQG